MKAYGTPRQFDAWLTRRGRRPFTPGCYARKAFDSRADAFLKALPRFVDEANELTQHGEQS